MTKILTSFTLFIIAFTSLFVAAAEIEVGVISDTTSIYDDLIALNLTPNDYILLPNTEENASYDQVYVIAIGENRNNDESTDVYFYFYNPLNLNIMQDYYFDLSINNEETKVAYLEETDWFKYKNDYDNPDVFLEFVNYSNAYNITKAKFSYVNQDNERKYEINEIVRLSDKKIFGNPFSCTYEERLSDNRLVADFEYNSFIYITNDVLVPVVLEPEFKWSEIFDFVLSNENYSTAFFYNFSSSKEIEQILELDVVYNTEFVRSEATFCLPGVSGYEGGYVEPQTNIKRTLYNEKHTYEWLSSKLEFETFKTPSKDRFTDEEFGYLEFTDEQKKLFTNYQHSVLIDLQNIYRHSISILGSGSVMCLHYSDINDLVVTRIKFQTNGTIYNSYVADDPDDAIDPVIPDNNKDEWWQALLKWIIENPGTALFTFIGIVIGLSLVISILTSVLANLIKKILF